VESGFRRNDKVISGFQEFLPPENPFSSPCYSRLKHQQSGRVAILDIIVFRRSSSWSEFVMARYLEAPAKYLKK